MKNVLYEDYHKNRKLQKRILTDKNFTYRSLIGILKKYVKSNFNILDIGCGTGAIDFYLANRGCNVTGLDISKNAIKVAILNAQNLGYVNKTKFLVAKFPSVKLNSKYDLIICSEVLEHLKDDYGAMGSIHRSLKKGGLVIASSPSINAPLYKLGLLDEFDKKVGHVRRYEIKTYLTLFNHKYFKVLDTFKTEGVLRNFLFTNKYAGELIRVIRGPVSDWVTYLDNITICMFGESQIFVIARKK
jgi:2-polyprenyl-3-methyl-5-hydroxy-6-metoxy-1,4-benzoquinol methylase